LPIQAYYSAWYYLPQSVTVGVYWYHEVSALALGDPPTQGELFDVNLTAVSRRDVSATLRPSKWRLAGAGCICGCICATAVPVNAWFQLEAFYRDADDSTGHLTLWLNGKQILDWQGANWTDDWVAWDVVSVGDKLTPEPAILYVDDCAVSRTRVGPARPCWQSSQPAAPIQY